MYAACSLLPVDLHHVLPDLPRCDASARERAAGCSQRVPAAPRAHRTNRDRAAAAGDDMTVTRDTYNTAHARPPHTPASRASHAQRKSVCIRPALTPPRPRRPHTSSPLDNPAVHRAPQMTKFLSAIAYRMRLWLRSPNPMWQGVSKRSNDLKPALLNNTVLYLYLVVT